MGKTFLRRLRHTAFAPILLFGAAAHARQNVPVTQGGWDTYGYSSHATCRGLPVLLAGNHQDLTVDGNCTLVRVAGRHNDILVVLAPGGTIEITGAHNDVTWKFGPGPHLAPRLLDHGESNTFHTGG